eukprot:8789464-Alexandrium_andersonii.AAC.1
MCPTPHWASGRAIRSLTHSSPGARGHRVLVQEVRAPLQLQEVDLGHELQVHPGLALPPSHHRR